MTVERRSLATLRFAAMAALSIGAAGTLALMLRAGGRNRPLVLVPLFAVWDLSPYALLLAGDRYANTWRAPVRIALYSVSIAVTIGSVAYYIADVVWPRTSQAAFPYVVAPPVACLVIAVVMTAAFVSSRR
jgi:hypothetical protein